MSDTELTIRQASAIDAEATADQVLEALAAVEFLAQAAREARAALHPGVIEWIDAHGDLTVGDVRYYVGKKTKKKPKSVSTLAEAVLIQTEGDLESFCEFLSANAFKPGECKKRLGPDAFGDLFEVTVEPDLKTGKPKKELKRVDARFAGPAR